MKMKLVAIFKKTAAFFAELGTRIIMNLVKVTIGTALGIAVISIQFNIDVTVINRAFVPGNEVYNAAAFLLAGFVIAISLIETPMDWEKDPPVKTEKPKPEQAGA